MGCARDLSCTPGLLSGEAYRARIRAGAVIVLSEAGLTPL